MKRQHLVIALLLLIAALAIWARIAPLPAGLLDDRRYTSTVITDRNGVVLFDELSDNGTRTKSITPAEIPPYVAAATIAAEDRRFYKHPGIDPLAVLRASLRNLREQRVVEGGSTITQQVAKLLTRKPGERNFRSKAHEASIALRLEHHLDKRAILALYLNRAPYGNQYVGIEQASRGYFGVPASELTVAQAALLAALPQRPSEFNPRLHLDAAQKRQRSVLRRMVAAGAITPAQCETAMGETIRLARSSRQNIAPHFVEHVRNLYPDPALQRIETTLDARLQEKVRGVIDAHRPHLERHAASNVAVVVLDNRSGEWLAWEGSGDYFDAEKSGAIDGVLTTRQPGSTLKPFTYALAFERGETPATVLPDIELQFPTAEEGIVYAPRNYDGKYRGPMLARSSLAGSVNVPAVWLLSRLGTPSLLRFLKAAGVHSLDRTADYYGLGLTLGSAELTLGELVAAYSTFARGGTFAEPVAIRSATGTERKSFTPKRRGAVRLVSPRTAFWISDVLSDNEARSFAFGRGGSLEFPYRVAVKTGTSQAYRDNWTVGYTREVTVGVWVGNFDRKELRDSSGVTGAAPIFHAVMLAAQEHVTGMRPEFDDRPLLDPTPDLRRETICLLSGMQATAACPRTGDEWLPASHVAARCNWHRVVMTAGESQAVVDWPPLFAAWGRAHSPERAAPLVARKIGGKNEPLQLLHPADGAEYLLDPTLRDEFQTVRLRAAAAGNPQLEWLIDGKLFARAAAAKSLRWPLEPGRHVVEVRDRAGRAASATIVVR